MTRENAAGMSIGVKYQMACIKSWIDNGFEVYTINSRHEKIPEILRPLVKCLTVERDAFFETGKHILFMSDILNEIKNIVSDEPFCITNADVILRKDSGLSKIVPEVKEKMMMVERRNDFKHFDQQVTTPFRWGFDLFVFHSKDIPILENNEFVIGMPWWDYFLPLACFFSGMSRFRAKNPLIYHLEHTERWNGALWTKYGEIFVRSISSLAYATNGVEKGHSAEIFKTYTANLAKFRVQSKTLDEFLGKICKMNLYIIERW